MKKSPFANGLADGIPIALGYLSVSFGFGILAVRSGLTTLVSVIISAASLGEALSPAYLIALLLILAGIVIQNLPEGRHFKDR